MWRSWGFALLRMRSSAPTNISRSLYPSFPFLRIWHYLLLWIQLRRKYIFSHQFKKLTIIANGRREDYGYIIANGRVEDQYGYIRELNLDTPNLLSFSWSNFEVHAVRSNILMNSTLLAVVDLQLWIGHYTPLGTQWFIKLQQFLGNFTPEEALNLIKIKASQQCKSFRSTSFQWFISM